MIQKTLSDWEEDTLTWNSRSSESNLDQYTYLPNKLVYLYVLLRPELSEAVASFDNLPVEFQLFINIDMTELFLADPGG